MIEASTFQGMGVEFRTNIYSCLPYTHVLASLIKHSILYSEI